MQIGDKVKFIKDTPQVPAGTEGVIKAIEDEVTVQLFPLENNVTAITSMDNLEKI